MAYTEIVDRIYARGASGQSGFISENYYVAYQTWRERAMEIDAEIAIPGNQWMEFLDADHQNGLLDYNKGYMPLYNLFVLGQVGGGVGAPPGRRRTGGGIEQLLNNKLVLAGAAVAAFLLLRHK